MSSAEPHPLPHPTGAGTAPTRVASAPVAVARDKSPAADVASVRAVLAELVAAVLGQAVPDDLPLMQARRKRGG